MDLYSEILLDHYKHPHNNKPLKKHTHRAKELNPLCGDSLTIDLEIDLKGKIKNVSISPKGCAISTASASILSDYILGKNIKQVAKLKNEDIIKMLNIEITPGRFKCAILPLATIKKILN